MKDATPMMAQYRAIKAQHPNALLFFRLGDFYELFFEDAITGSKELGITLTGRDAGSDGRAPMCGVPYHAVDDYIKVLVEKGYRVAICDQMEDPSLAKGLVRRNVTRVITPGTYWEAAENASATYIGAISSTDDKGYGTSCKSRAAGDSGYGICACDLSTGEVLLASFDEGHEGNKAALDELGKLLPKECVIRTGKRADDVRRAVEKAIPGVFVSLVEVAEEERRWTACSQVFGADWVASLCGSRPSALDALETLLTYLSETQMIEMRHLREPVFYLEEGFMEIDRSTKRNLELTERLSGGRDGTLLWVLDRCETSMGSRLLRQWIERPLTDCGRISDRLSAVDTIYSDSALRNALCDALSKVKDLERLVTRIAYKSCNARDLVAVASSLEAIPGVRGLLSSPESPLTSQEESALVSQAVPPSDAVQPAETPPTELASRTASKLTSSAAQPASSPTSARLSTASPLLQSLAAKLDDVPEVAQRIRVTLADDPPLSVTDGDIVRPGFSPEIDELRVESTGGKKWVLDFEAAERQRTGIKNLKVAFNRVFGYYIEVSNANLSAVPDDYVRKQTLSTGERFVTPELRARESAILGAEQKLKQEEYRVFCELRDFVSMSIRRIQKTARAVAEVDALTSLAQVAIENAYVKPEVVESGETYVKDGRHPVLEKVLPPGAFVPNDLRLDYEERVMVITGPNMGGKSTYCRQAALIILMAQMGSFVPARSAKVACADRLFARVGAYDDLVQGQSTFMVEMTEVSNILKNATAKSLVILDEIGRGTSTFDGLSVAWAVVEHIADTGPRALVATHYRELTLLADLKPSVVNYTVAVKKKGDEVVFLRKVGRGVAEGSFGIEVSIMAGIPPQVSQRAREILLGLEAEARKGPRWKTGILGQVAMRGAGALFEAVPGQGDLFSGEPQASAALSPGALAVLEELSRLDIDFLSPKAALEKLYELKTRLQSEEGE